MAAFFGTAVPDMVLKSLFMKYDTNEDNSLSAKELRVLLAVDLGMDDIEVEAFILLIDLDGNKRVSYDEFKTWIHSPERSGIISDPKGTKYQLLLKAVEYFQQFDLDSNGALEGAEIARLMASIGVKKEGISEALKVIDRDQNGKISFEEFLRWLNWIPINDL